MSDEQLEKLRHSTAHIMAEAVMRVFPEAKFAIGPSIEDGFYYDFDLPRPLTPEDLETIEAEMRKIIKAGYPFQRQEVSTAEAEELFADQPYKLELIEDMPEGEVLSIYEQG
ncbi:MAG: threonine--tRNA ligase, partial [Anaerolineae bacterium]|nr:threonine--tRNA ligase [Anaerolineae bacterium]